MTDERKCAQPAHAEPPSVFQLLILLLSVFVLAAMAAEAFLPLTAEQQDLLYLIDALVCAVFLCDFFYRLYRAPSRAAFMRWGWIDLVSSIPVLPALRWGRLVRVVRLLRLLRGFRSLKVLLECLYRNRDRAVLATTAIGASLIALFSSIVIATVETVPASSLRSAGDALWWSFYTLANIDYMGHFPVTPEGKLVRFLLVVSGMVLFGVFAGYAASYFLEDDEAKQSRELELLRREVEQLRSGRRQEGAR